MSGRALGAVVLGCWVAHAIDLAIGYPLANLLWSCNVATLLLAIGLASGRERVVAIGTLLLIVGEPFWIFGILIGDFTVTSPLTHVVAPLVGLASLRRSGSPRGIALPALAVVSLATLAARAIGPASENVNLAHVIPPHAVPEGWRAWFSHGHYMAAVFLGLLAACVAIELAMHHGLKARAAPARSPQD